MFGNTFFFDFVEEHTCVMILRVERQKLSFPTLGRLVTVLVSGINIPKSKTQAGGVWLEIPKVANQAECFPASLSLSLSLSLSVFSYLWAKLATAIPIAHLLRSWVGWTLGNPLLLAMSPAHNLFRHGTCKGNTSTPRPLALPLQALVVRAWRPHDFKDNIFFKCVL